MTRTIVIATVLLASTVLTWSPTGAGVAQASDSEVPGSTDLSDTVVGQVPLWDRNKDWSGSCRSGCGLLFDSYIGFRVEYRRTRLALSFPSAQEDSPGGPHFLTTELALKNGDDLAVFLDMEYLPVTTLGIFARAGMNHPSSQTMVMDFTGALGRTVGLGSAANTISPWEWEAHPFQWWMAEGGMRLSVTDNYWVILGFRAERFDITLKNPVAGTSVPLGGFAVTPVRLLQRADATGQLRSDPEITSYMPYIGIGGDAGKGGSISSKWRIIGTPYGWTNVKIPFTINAMSPASSEMSTSIYDLATERSILVEADFQTNFTFNSVLSTTFRVTGGLFQCQGDGQMKTAVGTSNLFGVLGGTYPYEDAQVNRSFFSLGLSMDIRF